MSQRARELPIALPIALPDALTDADDKPKFLQIAATLVDEIRRGRLRPGDRLPGSRVLAQSLGVHRNTVLAALQELIAQGWLRSAPARGTYVASDLPTARSKARSSTRARPTSPPPIARRVLGFPLPPADRGPHLGDPALFAEPVPRGTLALLGGQPDLRLLPLPALARAYRRVMAARGGELLRYDDPQGDPCLRTSLMRLLCERRGLTGDASSLLLTRGSQMALYLIAQALLRPGDVVAVEDLGYPPAWAALRQAGAELVPIPVDAAGLDVAALARLARTRRVRAVYLTPHHQYPTTAMLGPGRRLQLLALARAERMAILEDDYDHEFHYEGRPVLPLASADRDGLVVYIGTLSKLLAPGLRIGFVWAPPPLLARLTALRVLIDRQGDHGVQRAIAELIDDGEVERHAWRCRRAYAARREHLMMLLQTQLADVLQSTPPPGGMALWARVADGIDVNAWLDAGRRHGVLFQPGQRFDFAGRPLPYVRLGFACLNEDEQHEAVRRLRRALPRPARQQSS